MYLRLARSALTRLPWWAWIVVGAIVGPWYLAYFALVLKWAGVVAFWMPAS